MPEPCAIVRVKTSRVRSWWWMGFVALGLPACASGAVDSVTSDPGGTDAATSRDVFVRSPDVPRGFDVSVPDGGPRDGGSRDVAAVPDVSPVPGQAAARIGPVTLAAAGPPPLTGGTLLVLRDGLTAVASDPDRDAVWIVRLDDTDTAQRVFLQDRDEPGRLVEDDGGMVHVALRRGGAVATIDPRTRMLVARRPVCAAPRGIAFDAMTRSLLVACGGGELATLPTAGGTTTVLRLEPDLRDVAVRAGRRLVTRFRAADLLELGADGRVARRTAAAVTPLTMRTTAGTSEGSMQPAVAWRSVSHPTAGMVMAHQTASTLPFTGPPNVYYGATSDSACTNTTILSAVTVFPDGAAPPVTYTLAGAVLPVDVALDPMGTSFLVAAPGNANGGQVLRYMVPARPPTPSPTLPRICLTATRISTAANIRHVVAVAWDGRGRPVYQSREPAGIHIHGGRSIFFFEAPSVENTGHTLFHLNAGRGIACASCHPEGGDDGRTWNFDRIGGRRTPPVRGATSDTAPFHWDGDLATAGHLMAEVFGVRMGGGNLPLNYLDAARAWIDTLAPFPVSAPADPAAAARGRALFESAEVGCAGCHSGPNFTNNQNADVGTGGAFQVPPLRGLAWRAPYFHDGRAPTLSGRFAADRSDNHGRTSQLNPEQVSDLVSYLETL